MCQARGQVAQMRFDAEGYGFRRRADYLTATWDMFVEMEQASDSTWQPSNDNTFVSNQFESESVFEMSDAQIGGLVAHEEEHHRGNLDFGGVPDQTQATCES